MSSPSTVLVLSPDPLVEMVVRHLLPVEQYAVRRLTDRAEAADLLEQEARLAVLDLPDMDAINLTFVRDLHTRAGKPLVVLTNDPARLAGQLEPAVRLLDRPPQLDQLHAALNAALAEPAPASAPDGPPAGRNRRRLASLVGAVVLGLAAFFLLGPMLHVPGMTNYLELYFGKKDDDTKESTESVTLLPGQLNAFELPDGVVAKMKIPKPYRIAEKAQVRTHLFSGTLGFDPDRMVPIQPRFAGEVIALGTTDGKPIDETRPDHYGGVLGYGNRVKQGQQVAVIWSSTLGEKKSELVDALVQYNLASKDLQKLRKIEDSISQAVLRAAEAREQQTQGAVTKAEYALRIWRVTDEELKAVKDDAARLIKERGEKVETTDSEKERWKKWARVEVVSPGEGVIVEKNVPNRPVMIDLSQKIFVIADLSSLLVYAHIYEEDQPELQRLRQKNNPAAIPWRVYLTSDPMKRPLASPGIKRLGLIVDPTQHTNMAVGNVDNRDRLLTVGAFVTAEVDFPPPPDVVSIPVGALDEDGATSSVLVQLDPDHHRYALRRVKVVQRFLDFAYVSSKLTDTERASGLSVLVPGDLVVTGGAVQLKPALEEAQSHEEAKKRAAEAKKTEATK
jgi:cobalt-zinc-cadmium efflux system membrane fusion protein